jgi:1-deoxy-D-xylulose-5-phosphate reductoisomerase
MKEKVVLLGGTGSIGKSSLDVLRTYPKDFYLVGVSAHSNLEELARIIDEFTPQYVCLKEENTEFINRFPGINFAWGREGIADLAELSEADTIINAIPGIAGLAPTLAAIAKDKRILSANKEAFVAAGEIINAGLDKSKAVILPVDSEHNAIFNLFTRFKREDIQSIKLTASGGPFLRRDITENIEIADVLKHPTWNMGPYITVNSATMMNKGFEVLEAHHLFRMDYDDIKVLIHPQSQVHGMIETVDGSQFICASPNDMRYPIALSLFHPRIPIDPPFGKIDMTTQNWDFEEPDTDKFPLLKLAYEVGKAGGVLPAVLNAANEIVVEKFLSGIIPFKFIPEIIKQIVDQFENTSHPRLEEILIADKNARIQALKIMNAILEQIPDIEE